jgi:hypothetical protein
VFFGLGHNTVIGGDGEKNQIDAVGAGKHVFDETLVTGDIDDSRLGAIGQIEVGEPEIDGDPAFFFWPAVPMM